MRLLKAGILVCSAISLSACHKVNVPDVTGLSEAKSMEFFQNNAEVTKQVAEKCRDFMLKGYSVLSPSDQKVWEDSTDGINCRNAQRANVLLMMIERNRRIEEQDRKFK